MTGRVPMTLRKNQLLLAFLMLFGLVISGRADDANIQMTTTNGSTVVGFQDSAGKDVVLVNSLGGLTVSSNTILPGTTFYQDGTVFTGTPGKVFDVNANVQLGAANNSVIIASNTILPGTTFYQDGTVLTGTSGKLFDINGTVQLGAAGNSVQITSNTIMPGATFYQSGAIYMGATALSVNFSSNVVVSGGNATIYQNGRISVSSGTFNGYMQLLSTTNTALHAITPTVVGQLYYCNNCAATSIICVSTGTTISGFASVVNKATACN
jgi:hypothetical protein